MTLCRKETIRAGAIGGLAGGITIWIYEAIVWSGIQGLMPLAGIPRNATGLVFGKAAQDSLGWPSCPDRQAAAWPIRRCVN